MSSVTITQEPAPTHAFDRMLKVFRAATPLASGVVLATDDGWPLAHDLPAGADARAVAGVARAERARVAETHAGNAPASAFVEANGSLTLVVFLPS